MNTIRELKQKEKYKTMLKRKNKEKNIYKTQNATLRIKYEGIKKLLDKKDKEIERLNNVLIELVKWLHNEIKRLDKMQDTYDKHGKKKDPNIIYISGAYIEVLDKLQELTGDGSNEN